MKLPSKNLHYKIVSRYAVIMSYGIDQPKNPIPKRITNGYNTFFILRGKQHNCILPLGSLIHILTM
jgi:hypothetical protein